MHLDILQQHKQGTASSNRRIRVKAQEKPETDWQFFSHPGYIKGKPGKTNNFKGMCAAQVLRVTLDWQVLPKSLFFVIAAAALARGPCCVKWYPNLRILVFSSSILAISTSARVPSCCLYLNEKYTKTAELRGSHKREIRIPSSY